MGFDRSKTMRVHPVYLNPLDQGLSSVRGNEAKHLIKVLRVKPKAELRLFDGLGNEAKGIVIGSDKYSLELEVFEVYKAKTEPAQEISLAISLLKADKLATVVRKATELGVREIKLFYSQYSEIQKISDNKLQRLNRISLEAAKQSARAYLPIVHAPVALQDLALAELNILAHPYAQKSLAEIDTKKKNICIITGPEGGFSDAELKELNNIQLIKLGPRILRAETAPVALISAILIPNAI